jgi:hypothetical protein
MSPRRYFQVFSNMPIPDYDKDLGTTLWSAFTAISGFDKLFRFTPPTITNGLDNDKASTDQDQDKQTLR